MGLQRAASGLYKKVLQGLAQPSETALYWRARWLTSDDKLQSSRRARQAVQAKTLRLTRS